MFEVKEIKSSDQNVSKFIFTKENAVAEAVLYKYPTYEERTVICCSTQSGCPVGCRFCGTGEYFVRNLSSEEIVYQVDYLLKSKNIDSNKINKFQIMVMSMGEPLLNFKQLRKAFYELYKKYPNAKLLISTIAPRIDFEQVFQMAQEIPTIGLQFSVHESNDFKRNQLIPYKNKYSIREISELGEQFLLRTHRKPFFNYCAKEDNISNFDADSLSNLLNPIVFEATISVVCESDESMASANERQRDLANSFMNKLVERGYSTRMFDPAGQDDIGGGCGQLWFVQDWMKKNSHKIKKSAGYGKEKIHCPK